MVSLSKRQLAAIHMKARGQYMYAGAIDEKKYVFKPYGPTDSTVKTTGFKAMGVEPLKVGSKDWSAIAKPTKFNWYVMGRHGNTEVKALPDGSIAVIDYAPNVSSKTLFDKISAKLPKYESAVSESTPNVGEMYGDLVSFGKAPNSVLMSSRAQVKRDVEAGGVNAMLKRKLALDSGKFGYDDYMRVKNRGKEEENIMQYRDPAFQKEVDLLKAYSPNPDKFEEVQKKINDAFKKSTDKELWLKYFLLDDKRKGGPVNAKDVEQSFKEKHVLQTARDKLKLLKDEAGKPLFTLTEIDEPMVVASVLEARGIDVPASLDDKARQREIGLKRAKQKVEDWRKAELARKEVDSAWQEANEEKVKRLDKVTGDYLGTVIESSQLPDVVKLHGIKEEKEENEGGAQDALAWFHALDDKQKKGFVRWRGNLDRGDRDIL